MSNEAGKQKLSAEKFGWTPKEWSEAVGCSLTTTYELKKQGKIKFVKLGLKKSLVVTHPADFLAALAAEEQAKWPVPKSRVK